MIYATIDTNVSTSANTSEKPRVAEVFFRRFTFIIIIAGKAYKILNE